MATGIDLATERSRFQTTFQSIPVPQRSQTSEVENLSVPAVPVDPVHDLIVEAQTAYNSMDNDGARALFEKVLREYDPNSGSALYGLGLLASRAADVEQSQSYFERTVRSNSADPSMKVWSYIYLGHIADLQCQRERATEYYRQAVQVGDNSRDAQASAKSGLNKAFGEQCR
jgi:tetratricopeptide (TPR) repeat protein